MVDIIDLVSRLSQIEPEKNVDDTYQTIIEICKSTLDATIAGYIAPKDVRRYLAKHAAELRQKKVIKDGDNYFIPLKRGQKDETANDNNVQNDGVIYLGYLNSNSELDLDNIENIFSIISNTGGQIIAHKRMIDDLKNTNNSLIEQKDRDSLTGLYRRNKLVDGKGQLLEDIIKKHKKFSVLMIDADNFKGYNDNYGHAQGDVALKTIASIIKRSVNRESDIVARYGGEEFIVFLPDTDEKGAKNIAEKIKSGMEDTVIDTVNPDYVYKDNEQNTGFLSKTRKAFRTAGNYIKKIRKQKQPAKTPYYLGIEKITVSIGYAGTENCHKAEQVIGHADKALGFAKNLGRNQVYTIPPHTRKEKLRDSYPEKNENCVSLRIKPNANKMPKKTNQSKKDSEKTLEEKTRSNNYIL